MQLKLLPVILLTYGVLIAKTVEAQDTEPTPTESTPTESTPTESTPTESTPTESTPTESTPTESTPTESTPTKSTPTESTPTESTPTKSTPTESTPTESTPTESTPTESTPTKSTPTESTPTESTPTKSTPTESTPTESTPTESTPTESTPTESTTTDSTTTEPPSWVDYPAQVPNGNEPPCIFSKMSIALTVTYETKNNENKTGTISVPEKPTTSGTCGKTESSMILSWPVPTKSKTRYISSAYSVYVGRENKITFHFMKNNSRTTVDKIDIEITLDETNFPNAKLSTLTTSTGEGLDLFATSTEDSKYVCSVPTDLTTKSGVGLSIKDVQLITFNDKKDLTQKSVENCEPSEVESANVGAIVGGVIAAVVVVGIVGFIIWRRRKNSYTQSEVA